jgi:hypothetical protein
LGQLLQRLPLVAILLWWIIRLSSTGAITFNGGLTLGVLSHFALLIVSALTPVFQGLKPDSFILGFKQCLRPAVLYALLAALSTVAYHHAVQSESTALRKLERERFIDQQLGSEDAYAALQADDPQLSGLTRSEAHERAMDSLRFHFNPLWHFTASLLLWVAASMSTALFIAGLWQWLQAWPR